MPVLRQFKGVPEAVLDRLDDLKQNLSGGDIDVKSYCDRKWSLLESFASGSTARRVNEIRGQMESAELNEKEAYGLLYNVLDTNGADLESAGCSKAAVAKPSQKITSYFEKKPRAEEATNGKKRRPSDEQSVDKKAKTDVHSPTDQDPVTVTNGGIKASGKAERCTHCRQPLDSPDLLIYNGHPNNAVDEFVALTDPRLMLFTGEEHEIHSGDERPQNKITYFSVYDRRGHLCPFDSGLIERNVLLYFSGYVKPVYEDGPQPDGGIPTKDMGPINEWWVSGFDGGENALVGFSTAYGEYYLMEPSDEYRPLMEPVRHKIFLSKLVIEFLLDEAWQSPSYEDLLNRLQTCVPPERVGPLSEEGLLRHAQFICDQVTSFDEAAAADDDVDGDGADRRPLVTTPCVRALVKLAGVTFGRRRALRRGAQQQRRGEARAAARWSKATTTALVRQVFESFFPEQLDGRGELTLRRKRCGVCEACQQPDCGQCAKCLDMTKFGGTGRGKQACVRRRCPNMAIQDADESDSEERVGEADVDGCDAGGLGAQPRRPPAKRVLHEVRWPCEPAAQHAGRIYHSEALVDGMTVRPGDCVTLDADQPGTPLLVARVAYMWADPLGGAMFHAHLFCRGSDTVLGECANPCELFEVDECENCPLGSIVRRARVEARPPASYWREPGGLLDPPPAEPGQPDDEETFFYHKRYVREFGRFEDLEDTEALPGAAAKPEKLGYKPCDACRRNFDRKRMETPRLEDGVVHWRGQQYAAGCGVYLRPGTFHFRSSPVSGAERAAKKEETVDEELYPEFYRKSSDSIKGSNLETPEPFCIGYVTEVLDGADIRLRVQKTYRPENTHRGPSLSQQLDLNLVYWSEEHETVSFARVTGRCHLVFSENLDVPPQEWSDLGPDRFYFSQSYDVQRQQFVQVEGAGCAVGRAAHSKGKGGAGAKVKGSKKVASPTAAATAAQPELWPRLERPLRAMDVFAGCGGLSEGLHVSGVAVSKWAIEKEEAAAHAYRLNNPDTTVYSEDCNLLLRLAMAGERRTAAGQPLPAPGDVELLCGGPPCQGFSGMNRFNAGQYSLFKNSLIVSYLSYCDFYRPRHFILENVRNFVSFKRSMVLKLTLRCLLAMGYQCTFGVLQAGNYGVPQTRRRLIVLAAAPGERLPRYPEPTHVFNRRAMQLNVAVDECRYTNGTVWTESAPRRTITVRDAMSDLPEVRNGCNVLERPYDSVPLSHFQRRVRGADDGPLLRDHVCKEMAPLVEARMAHVPTAAGSDWRDLPNMETRLSDGTYTRRLRYGHRDRRGALRGVCACAAGGACDPADRQYNTLIPWCLPHTGNRHNHWAGLYGRLDWDGYFSTTVTNPEPMGKQGRVLHPTQNRVVSVRECARSQGFPDRYRFYGSVLDKHRQVGNAVPPPMGTAIGLEIRRAVAAAAVARAVKEELMKAEVMDVKVEGDEPCNPKTENGERRSCDLKAEDGESSTAVH